MDEFREYGSYDPLNPGAAVMRCNNRDVNEQLAGRCATGASVVRADLTNGFPGLRNPARRAGDCGRLQQCRNYLWDFHATLS